MSLPLKCVVQHGPKFSTRCAGSGASRELEWKSRSAAACALPEATEHELQSNLPMAASCAEHVGDQERPRCEPGPSATSAGPGAT